MPYRSKVRSLYIIFGIICWFLLLANTLLLVRSNLDQQPTFASEYLGQVLSVIFILLLFLHQRAYLDQARGVEFITYLWRLLIGAGFVAYLSVVLDVGNNLTDGYLLGDSPYLANVLYLINFAFFVYFLAKACYVWRQLILFQKTKFILAQWTWFEILVFSTLLLPLLRIDSMNVLMLGPMLLLSIYTVFISIHLKWVAYLSFTKKWRSIFLLLAILLALFIFARYFYHESENPDLIMDYLRNPFLQIALLFSGMYALVSLLVALFSLPTSSVFEQKQADLLNFQRLSQSIQQGQNESQVYSLLFDSAIKAATADAGWFETKNGSRISVLHQLNIEHPHIDRIRHLLKDYNIDNIDYINNNLDHNSGFRSLELPYRSLIVLPLKTKKRTFGILYLLKEIEHGFDREVVSVLRTFTSQTILTIENRRLVEVSIQNERYKEELKIASNIQNSLIPKTFPSDRWFEISTYSVAAKEVGGDFYDFLQLSASRIAIIIGDVSGKGITAAFHMAQMKGIFHGLMQLDFPPDEFMVYANRALTHCLERSSFITSAIYIIDYEQKGFTFARAGHCHTLYHNCMTDETFFFKTDGLGLGIIRNDMYKEKIHRLHYDYNPGDVMVIYTDGITEARSPDQEEYGAERLSYLLSQTYHLEAEDIKYAIINDLNEFTGSDHLHDDQTLLVIKFKSDQPKFTL